MSNSSSPSKPPLSQEIKNPNSLNFSIPLPEGSLSTPVCGVSEIDKSITPHIEVLVTPKINPEDILTCSPTLVLFDKGSQNFEAQSVVKPSLETPIEGLEAVSQPGHISSTLSERLV
ncbi:hypothetical protein KY285_023899 [Solanum tuberosum]|nr:hypothetical protein KY289_024230 [Solanum tuberosum]KAH0676098.1 hypothetical protein KY285_023899 [Solanum tuberosum]